MKYIIIYGNGHSEQTNNKAKAIKWANEYAGTATVETVTGNILHENASQRRINRNLTKLSKIAASCKDGTICIL